MLDELRQFGEHDRLGKMIDRYLDARNPQDLYRRILERWEQGYGEGLVRRSLSLLWASRRGLSESELLDLLGTGEGPLSRAAWTPFFLAAEAALARRSGLLQFFDDYHRNAVREHCLGSPVGQGRDWEGSAGAGGFELQAEAFGDQLGVGFSTFVGAVFPEIAISSVDANDCQVPRLLTAVTGQSTTFFSESSTRVLLSEIRMDPTV